MQCASGNPKALGRGPDNEVKLLLEACQNAWKQSKVICMQVSHADLMLGNSMKKAQGARHVRASAGSTVWQPYLEMALEMAVAKADAWAPPDTNAFAVASAAAFTFAAMARQRRCVRM